MRCCDVDSLRHVSAQLLFQCGKKMSLLTSLQFLLLLSCFVVSSKIDDKSYNDLGKSRGLYGTDSQVIVLNVTNFKKTVYGTPNAWLVEFYNSWCGFCQRFAPMWSGFAADVLDWQEVVKIAALDCADDDNNPLCRDYEVMHYPSLRLFSANAKSGDLGSEMEKGKTEEDMRHNLVQLLKKEQLEGRGNKWPNIIPYRSNDVLNLWKNVPTTIKYTFLIFEEKDSFIGTEVILDLHSLKSIQIRRVINENEALCKLMGVFSYPSVVVLERNQNAVHLKVEESARSLFVKEIKSFLVARNIIVPERLPHFSVVAPPTKGAPSAGDANALGVYGDFVFQVDLDNTVQYSLKSEIPVRKLIVGRPLQALKQYLNVLAKYFPTSAQGKEFFAKLRDKINVLTSVKGETFLEIVESLESELKPVFLSSEAWVGCEGSAKKYRGYPCGLWTTFHALTTNAVVEGGNDVRFDSLEVLEAVLGYVTHFFGCQECSRHFQEMAARSMRRNVTLPDDGVLWLWSAHNLVNKRLSGDVTEDPKHPKVQFPSREACPACRAGAGADEDWVPAQVLAYLKQMYSRHSVVHGAESANANARLRSDRLEVVLEETGMVSEKADRRRGGWNFNVFDISLCVVLYAGSAVILVLVFVKFIVRKRYRKKAYIHDLLGKV